MTLTTFVSQVRYQNLPACQRMVRLLRGALEPHICLTPWFDGRTWRIRYTVRPEGVTHG